MSLDQNRLFTTTKQAIKDFLTTYLNQNPYLGNWLQVGGGVVVTSRGRLNMIESAPDVHVLAQPHVSIRKYAGEMDRTHSASGQNVKSGEYQQWDWTLESVTSDTCGGDKTCDDVSSAMLQLFAQGGAGRLVLKDLGIDIRSFDSGMEIEDDAGLYRNMHTLRTEQFLDTGNVVALQSVTLATVEMTGSGSADVTLRAAVTTAAKLRIRLLTGTGISPIVVAADTKQADGTAGTVAATIPATRPATTKVALTHTPDVAMKQVTSVVVTGGNAGERFVIETIPPA